MKHVINTAMAICTPVPYVPGPEGPRLAMVTSEWHRARLALSMPTNFNYCEFRADGMEVGKARNYAVDVVMNHDPRPEFLFFLDYDVVPQFDALTKLVYRARTFPDHDIFAGVYCCKSSPPEPLVYKDFGSGPFWDWTVGDLLTEGITGIHMGLTLIRTSLFDRMERGDDHPLFVTTAERTVKETGGLETRRGTEDLYFCRRAVEEAGAKILVDTSVLAGHIDHRTGKVFGLPKDSPPVQRAAWLPDAKKNGKVALDLGAGGTRREWPEHTTYTTDIRNDVGADYVMDSRFLNLPDNHFDLVASSHHLEHIGRWDQQQVWSEIYRVCKPDGSIEHIVPSLEWAAGHISDGHVDEHVYNVLYGAQETHGYERDLNTHYMGFTKEVAKALAAEAGFVDVAVKDYRDDESLGYNLVITGRKNGQPRTDSGGEPGNADSAIENGDCEPSCQQ